MHLLALISISITVLCETLQQLAFKHATRVPGGKFLWTAVGAAMYVPHLVCWFFALTLVPLAIGAPLLGASYITVPLAGRILFKEKVSGRRWLGIFLIVVGLALISREMPS